MKRVASRPRKGALEMTNRFEQMLESFSLESGGLTSILAEASRIACRETSVATKHLATLSQIASFVVSPVITFYVLWILREARERNLRRLYFVARDGYLVKQVADALIRSFGMPIETRYLYGSRQAWHLPAIDEFSGESLSWLFERTRTLSLRIVLRRLQIVPEQIAGTLKNLGWCRSTWDEPIDEARLAQLKRDLLRSVDFQDEIKRSTAEKRVMTLRYLKQEGVFEPVAAAIVDLGWHGRLQLSLEKLLTLEQPTRTLGLYFGLYTASPALLKLQTASYLGWDLQAPPKEKTIPSLVFLMESFCTAPHGSTTGYSLANGRVEPIIREQSDESLAKWGVSTVHEVIRRFACQLERSSFSTAIFNWDSRPALVRMFKEFSKNPYPAEARAWGAFPYEDEQGGAVKERLTRPYELTLENLRIAFTFGEERFLPASWKVLWNGAQPHVHSLGATILRCALKAGNVKRLVGQYLRAMVTSIRSERRLWSCCL